MKLLPVFASTKGMRTNRPSLHFSPPDVRSTRYDRQDFAFPSQRLLAGLYVLFKYSCARLFPPPDSRLVLTALSRTSPHLVVRNAGQVEFA
ncbi:MAG: hypothetical protein F4X39_10945 [Acidobacteriia bacterium]|nr:hypothetical protein [Terriglobia bacterium]